MNQFETLDRNNEGPVAHGLRRLIAGFGAHCVLFSGLWLADRSRPTSEKPASHAHVTMLRLPPMAVSKKTSRVQSPLLRRLPGKALLPPPVRLPSATPTLPAPPVLAAESRPVVSSPTIPALPSPIPAFEARVDTAPVRRQAAVVGTFGSPQPVSPPERPRPALEEAAGFSHASAFAVNGPRKQREVVVGSLAPGDSLPKSRTTNQTVEVAGFASSSSVPRASRETALIATGGFEQRLMAEAPIARKQVSEGRFEPVEILSKPRPEYTEAARRLGIEGEVALRILFGIDGKLKVLGVVQGLGHGLDENAASAAARIEFRPARRNGQPIEQAALVRVQFHLAQ